MIQKVKEKMQWGRLHHLYLGLVGTAVSVLVAFKFVKQHDLAHIGPCILAGFLSLSWALDDWIYHQYGKKTPCWHLEQWLRKFKWWVSLEAFVNKLIGGRPE